MGLSPAAVWAMSLWEFNAAWAGWVRANSVGDTATAPSLADHQALIEKAIRNG